CRMPDVEAGIVQGVNQSGRRILRLAGGIGVQAPSVLVRDAGDRAECPGGFPPPELFRICPQRIDQKADPPEVT
ncbi:MAG TPA: hypothetical protein VLV83_23535, partial [Acidobacteriota bacterium]|nr:hypothetical protein [Acidobacteriota bacterium]